MTESPRESFLNYRDRDIGNLTQHANYSDAAVYGTKYLKHNFDRLVKVKTPVDPY